MTNRIKDLAALGKIDLQAPVKTIFVTNDKYLHSVSPLSEHTMLYDTLECIVTEEPILYFYKDYRNLIHKYRSLQYYVLTADNKFLKITTRTNKQTRGPILESVTTFPQEDKCFYFCRLHGRDFIGVDEYEVYREVFATFPKAERVTFLKVFLVYEHLAPTRVLDFASSDENIKIINEVNAFPKNDPEAFYWEVAKHTRYEEYTVTKNGMRKNCHMVDGEIFNRGYNDFITPKIYREICNSKCPLVWTRIDEDGYDYHTNSCGKITKEDV